MISLAGKAAVVTGCSRGIVAATVKMFAQAGADVVFSSHKNRDAAAHIEAKFASSRKPWVEDFSGCDCAPKTLPLPTTAGKLSPYSAVASTTSSSAGRTTKLCTW